MARFTLLTTLLAALAAHQAVAAPAPAPIAPKEDADLSLSFSLASLTLPSITIPTDISTISLPTGISTISLPTSISIAIPTSLIAQKKRDTPVGTATGIPLPPPFSGFPHPTGSLPPTGPAPTGPIATGAPKYPGGLLHPGQN